MEGWQAFLLGLVQGLTEFLPVSSSGHLMIFKELLGIDAEGFLDFTVCVHFATVLATIIVFWKPIWNLLKGLFRFRYNDETDYIGKLLVSMIPVALVGFLLRDQVEAFFGNTLRHVGVGLLVTSVLLVVSDEVGRRLKVDVMNPHRNGLSYAQAFLVGIAQAFAVAPGISRSGGTISVGLLCGVKREVMAQFSFLMVLAPIIGEQSLDLLKAASGSAVFASGVGPMALALGFIAAFLSGLFACKVMVALVRKARLGWFAIYCCAVAILLLLFF